MKLDQARLVPNLDAPAYTEDGHVTVLDFLPADTLTAVFDAARLVEMADDRYTKAAEAYEGRQP
jgi:hypothetical protein